jgi:membrane dipeptidase
MQDVAGGTKDFHLAIFLILGACFFDALDVMPAHIPAVVTHTGVQGVRPLWRNIDDAQIRAIAERNGTIGIICAAPFLAAEPGRRTYARIVDHMAHVIRVAGEDYVSLGSDFDGLITTPEGLPDITALPRLVQDMLERGWSDTRIQKILGGNFLRVVAQVQP